MSRDPLLFLEDILEACNKISSYVDGVGREELEGDSMRLDAVVRNFEILGEAARQLPQDIRDQLAEIPWRNIIGMRNILIHAYFGIDTDIVWAAATEQIAPLATAVATFLSHNDNG